MSLKHVLWDNDGVLVDTERLFFAATRDALATVGITVTRETFIDISLSQGRSLFDLADPDDQDRLRDRRNADYLRALGEQSHAIPGMEDLLRELHERVGMGVVTSSRRDHFDAMHERTGFLRYLDFVVARPDYRKAKPEPDAYLFAMKTHGINVADAIAVEDSPRGSHSAIRAGLRCLIVPNELTSGGKFPAEAEMCDGMDDLRARLLELTG